MEISEENMAIFVSVKDTGIGISKKEIDRLFKPYFKSSDSQSLKLNPAGKGLGLYISKQICIAAGGTLEVTSATGLGSRFEFTMPIKPDATYLENKKLKEKEKTKNKDFVADEELSNGLVYTFGGDTESKKTNQPIAPIKRESSKSQEEDLNRSINPAISIDRLAV